ncbi:hypothetical protein J6590_057275 [Homalodisca vitripennis]|nr:hypothetical protein J6590_057275 [Homalodisca vitripennis]
MIIDEYGGTKLDRHCLFSLTTSYLISIRHAQTVLVIEMRRVPPAKVLPRADVNKRKTSLEIVPINLLLTSTTASYRDIQATVSATEIAFLVRAMRQQMRKYSHKVAYVALPLRVHGYRKITGSSNFERGCCLDEWPLSDPVLASSPPAWLLVLVRKSPLSRWSQG